MPIEINEAPTISIVTVYDQETFNGNLIADWHFFREGKKVSKPNTHFVSGWRYVKPPSAP